MAKPETEREPQESAAAKPAPRSALRWLWRGLLGLLVIAALVPLSLWLYLRGSLAQLDGTVRASGLQGEVRLTRDALGIPTISGGDRGDLAYVTGFLHGQERYFQMDLLRRVAAGELSALFGKLALRVDRDHRLHRFRARAAAGLAQLDATDRAILDRYVAGVNDGRSALTTRPFEYAVLGLTPQPWQAVDTVLAAFAMYFDLQGNLAGRELARGWIRERTTAEQLAFLLPGASRWDAPLDAAEIPEPPIAIPESAPAWFTAPRPSRAMQATWQPSPVDTLRPPPELRSAVGSNNWAVAGSRSTTGGAIVANDMHLGIRLPHVWFRASIERVGGDGSRRRTTGVMLPGTPVIAAGSNGRVAWGFTNSYGDYLDLITLERDPQNPLRFKTPSGWETATAHSETLQVKGAADESMTVLETSLGPVWSVGGRAYAVHWIAHDPGAVNLRLLSLELADDLAAAQAVANTVGMPAQNFVAGDAAGHIGWTIAGPLPNRSAAPGATFPLSADQGALTFIGRRAPADYPRVVDPPAGQVWTANSRQLAGPSYATLGDGGADLGARAQQIRDDLSALSTAPGGKANEAAVYGISLDDRALFLSTFRDRALRTLDAAALAQDPNRAEFRRLLEQSWDGHASPQSVGYRLARGYLYGMYEIFFGGLDAELGQLVPGLDFDTASPRWPYVIARLIDEKPAGWLPAGYSDFRQVELAAIDHSIAKLTAGGKPLSAATWGAHNTSRFVHPFAAQIPFAKRWLAAPAEPQAGDENMPHVSYPTGGQSERMTVSPGHEESGIMNVPGGQSGHPLSPYFLAGHAAWMRGEPTPFLPGPTQHTLVFSPR